MQNAIRRQIKLLCARAMTRTKNKQKKALEYGDKFKRRTGLTPRFKVPTTTFPHKHFDPVYCKRNANFLAKTIWFKIQNGTYAPIPALRFEVPKASGGVRQIMQFSIPDSAVACVLNRRLTLRNLKNQSGNSFAYRPDRNVFDALLKIKSAIKKKRNFVIQLDFQNYFDSIPHEYLKNLLRSREMIIVSDAERNVIQKFLTHKYEDKASYGSGAASIRKIGTPQGSAISLGLANLANHPLDCQLEAINGQFSRYADDTVVLCYSYEDALKAYQAFIEHCENSGLIINRKKSPGIWILSDIQEEEFRTLEEFKFLGYGISANGLFMHGDVELRLKKKLSQLTNLYLIHYIQKHKPNLSRIGAGFDWDLMGLIAEIRNILYGGLTEEDLRQFIKFGRRLPQMKGLMGFYALLDKREGLARLDGWLASTIKQALFKRYKIIEAHGVSIKPSKLDALINGDWYSDHIYSTPSFAPDARMPSFVRAWAAARKYYYAFGLENVEAPKYVSYY